MASPPTILFRADASPEIGGGHVMRCLTLADALAAEGWTCVFAVYVGTHATVPALARSKHEVVSLAVEPADEAETLQQHWPAGFSWLAIDHYDRDAGFESACRPWAEQILVIDDLADRPHDCDLLLDQTLGRDPADYAGLVPARCRLMTGPQYALLRPEFAALRAEALERRAKAAPARRLLVSLGASDPRDITSRVLDGITQSQLELTVDVVLGAASPNLEAVRKKVATLPQETRLHVDTPDMARLMAEADLAIGAAGTSSWERCCLGLPSLVLVLAENQRLIAANLAAAGTAETLPTMESITAAELAATLRAMSAGSKVAAMAVRSAAICDGFGAQRLSLALLPPSQSKSGRPVGLRLARPDDERVMLDWQNAPSTRRFARNPEPPSAVEHHRWFQAALSAPDRILMVIEHDERAAGVLRLDRMAQKGTTPAFEISILVAPGERGQGLAPKALQLARLWQPAADLYAEVLPGNDASRALFETAGYRRSAEGPYLLPANLAQAHKEEVGRAET